MATLDKLATTRERLVDAIAAGASDVERMSRHSGVPEAKLEKLMGGQVIGYRDVEKIETALNDLEPFVNGEDKRVNSAKPAKRRDLVSGKTIDAEDGLGDAKPAPERRRIAQRGGKAIGANAAKAKAEEEAEPASKPVRRRLIVNNSRPASKPEVKPAKPVKKAPAEPFKARFSEDMKITRLKTAEERAKKGTAKHQQFLLYKDGMTVKSYLAKGGKRGWLNRDVNYGHIKVE